MCDNVEMAKVAEMEKNSLVGRARKRIFNIGTLEKWHDLNINGKVSAFLRSTVWLMDGFNSYVSFGRMLRR